VIASRTMPAMAIRPSTASAAPPSRRRIRPHGRIGPAAVGVAAVLALAACTGSMNTAIGPLDVDLPDLQPLPADGHPLPPSPTEWRLAAADRDAGRPIVILLPTAEVEVNPTGLPPVTPMPGRGDASRMPTAETAAVVSTSSWVDFREGLAWPLRSAGSLAFSPIGVFLRPPWVVQLQPDETFDRLPTEPVPPPPDFVRSDP
jgi:hypothetical protein